MNTRIGLSLAGAVLSALLASSAVTAATLDTGVLGTVNTGDHVVCNLLNIGTKPIEVSALELRNPVSGETLLGTSAVVQPGTRARVIGIVSNLGGTTNFYCHFDVKSSKAKVRANLSIGDNRTDVESLEAR